MHATIHDMTARGTGIHGCRVQRFNPYWVPGTLHTGLYLIILPDLGDCGHQPIVVLHIWTTSLHGLNTLHTSTRDSHAYALTHVRSLICVISYALTHMRYTPTHPCTQLLLNDWVDHNRRTKSHNSRNAPLEFELTN